MHVPVTYYRTNPSGSLAVHRDWAAYGVLPGLWLPDGRSVLPSMEEWHQTVTSQPSLGDLQQVLDTWLALGYRPLIDMKQCTLDTVGGDPVVLRPHSLLNRKLPVTYDQILDYLSRSVFSDAKNGGGDTTTSTSSSALTIHHDLRSKISKSMTFRHRRLPSSAPSSTSLESTTLHANAVPLLPHANSGPRHPSKTGGGYPRGTRRRW